MGMMCSCRYQCPHVLDDGGSMSELYERCITGHIMQRQGRYSPSRHLIKCVRLLSIMTRPFASFGGVLLYSASILCYNCSSIPLRYQSCLPSHCLPSSQLYLCPCCAVCPVVPLQSGPSTCQTSRNARWPHAPVCLDPVRQTLTVCLIQRNTLMLLYAAAVAVLMCSSYCCCWWVAAAVADVMCILYLNRVGMFLLAHCARRKL